MRGRKVTACSLFQTASRCSLLIELIARGFPGRKAPFQIINFFEAEFLQQSRGARPPDTSMAIHEHLLRFIELRSALRKIGCINVDVQCAWNVSAAEFIGRTDVDHHSSSLAGLLILRRRNVE